MVNNFKLDFWVQNNLNVLFIGKHGVGKTAKVKEAFERAGLKWRYFSASTMDPWVDFIGVPRAVEKGDKMVLEMVQPSDFAEDEVEALFFDEFNRAHKKVRNAVMELLQFRSINGRKFKNLRMIWAAINPDDEEDRYDVERLDEAQIDRFHVHIQIPYKCDLSWFSKEFGEVGKAAVTWWNELPSSTKERVSPRRLEYALRHYIIGGDLREVLPRSSNVTKLLQVLKTGPIADLLKKIIHDKNTDEARKLISDENLYNSAIKYIVKNKRYMKFFFPLFGAEKVSSLLLDKKCLEVAASIIELEDTLLDIYEVTANKRLKRDIKLQLGKRVDSLSDKACKVLGINGSMSDISYDSSKETSKLHGSYGTDWKHFSYRAWSDILTDYKYRLSNKHMNSTYRRMEILENIINFLPPKLSYKEAKDTIILINEILKKTRSQTVKKIANKLANRINYCLRVIKKEKHLDYKGLWSECSMYIDKITDIYISLDKENLLYVTL